jgi:F0F1-type ATP synthase membrane subunit c/vacuolar-type H+-ATPase subunit K
METRDIKVNLLLVLTLCLFLFPAGIGVASAQEEAVEGGITDSAWIAISAGIVMAASVLAGSWVIIAAIRTIAEKPEVLGHVLILVLLAGGIVTLGLLIAFMLWTKI